MEDKDDVGRLKVFNKDLFEDLMECVDEEEEKKKEQDLIKAQFSTASARARDLEQSRSSTLEAIQKAKQQQQRQLKQIKERKLQEEMERMKRITERNRINALKRREEKFQEMYTTLLREEGTFVKEINEFLARKEMADVRKKEELFNQWEEKVFKKIQHQIDRHLSSLTDEELAQRRHQMFDEFLDATNRKDGLFRDIIIESDYDPLKHRSGFVKYTTSGIEDPVKRDLEKMMRERQGGDALVQTRRPPKYATEVVDEAENIHAVDEVGRRTLDPKVWSKIEGTPYFDRSKMTEKKRQSAASSGVRKLYESRVPLDDYNVATGNEVVEAELPKGKRVFKDWKPQGVGQLKDPLPVKVERPAPAVVSAEE